MVSSNKGGMMLVPTKHYLLAAICLSCTLFFLYRELNQFFVERPTKQVSKSHLIPVKTEQCSPLRRRAEMEPTSPRSGFARAPASAFNVLQAWVTCRFSEQTQPYG